MVYNENMLKLTSIAGISYRRLKNVFSATGCKPSLSSRTFVTFPNVNIIRKPPWRVLFFGTDEFSLPSLKMLYREVQEGRLIKRLGIVTSLKSKRNPVREFADYNELSMFGWPIYVLPGDFDVGFVASFGHLIPEQVIGSFPLGMLNVHASLLPRWRGAAPIIYAILNGDTETGVTIMEVKPHKFDIGDIVCQERCPIYPTDTGPVLKSRLAEIGANLLFNALEQLPDCLERSIPQPDAGITYAPRIESSLAQVAWNEMTAIQVFNLHRALVSLYPLATTWHGLPIKLLEPVLLDRTLAASERSSNSWLLNLPGCVELDRAGRVLRVLCADSTWIGFRNIRIQGRKPMTAHDFYNGFISKRSATEWIFK
ncbi:hypothetical protein C0J52_00118 [Blattella germanica]|nr:hypothetical protein C0J52_00118 [Blattella germanica]